MSAIRNIIIALLMTCCAAAAAEKRYVADDSGALTASQVDELNDRARSISGKHQFNVAFLLSKRDYAQGETLWEYARDVYKENLGGDAHGILLAWDINREVWVMRVNNSLSRTIVPKKIEDDFWKVFQTNTTGQSYYDGISAYLDAAGAYLTKVNAQKQLKQIAFAHDFLNDYIGYIISILLLLLIAMTILSKLWSIRKQEFISIRVQKKRNNYRTLTMLALFPCMVFFLSMMTSTIYTALKYDTYFDSSLIELKFVIGGYLFCIVWFVGAYYQHGKMICAATGAKPLERRENKRVYNLVENLCMATNMAMPKINVVEDAALNAFASGINNNSYTVTLSRGMIDTLDDAELEAVVAHELTHIRNNDAKVMVVSVIFVGILSFLGQAALSMFSKSERRTKNIFVAAGTVLLGFLAIIPGCFVTWVMRSSLSCNREYLADAGSTEMTRNPQALASALRKISADPNFKAIKRKDVAQLFVHNPFLKKVDDFEKTRKVLFMPHPPIQERIKILEQYETS